MKTQACVKPFWPPKRDACDGFALVEFRESGSRRVPALIS